MKTKIVIITSILSSLITEYSFSQTSGSLDPSFGHAQYFNDYVNAMIQMSDGSIIAGGMFRNYRGQAIKGIAKLNNDLTPDISFTSGCPFQSQIYALAEYPGNRILAGGNYEFWDEDPEDKMIVMLNSDGSRDESFQSGFASSSGDAIYAIAVQPDGKIILGGDFQFYDGASRTAIVRINSDGSIDNDFSVVLTIVGSEIVNDIELLADGKILIGGKFTKVNGATCDGFAKLNSDGSNDPTFNLTAATDISFINDIELQPDGKILIGGQFSDASNIPSDNIGRLNSDGTIDPTFFATTMQAGALEQVYKIIYEESGTIVIAGEFELLNGSAVGCIGRLNPDGSTAPGFSGADAFFGSGNSNQANIFDAVLLPDGRYIVAGQFHLFNNHVSGNIAGLLNDGTTDPAMPADIGASGWETYGVQKILPLGDGTIWIGGKFEAADNLYTPGIAKLNADGTADPSFIANVDVGGGNEFVYDIDIQTDDKIIIAGSFETVNGAGKSSIARLKPNGNLDHSFHIGSGFDGDVYMVAVQPDGKILCGGYFNTYNGVTANNIARLNPDGTLDATFNPGGTGPDGSVRSLIVLPDGKIMIGGFFMNYNGILKRFIARLNADGTPDMTFDAGLTADGTNRSVINMAVQSDGKVVIAGDDIEYGTDRDDFMRLNADGTYDNTFITDNPNNFGENIYYIIISPEGYIMICGAFEEYNGIEVSKLARLNNDGSLDETFQSQVSEYPLNEGIYVMALNGNQLLAGGNFREYGGVAVNNMAAIIFNDVCPVPAELFETGITSTKATVNWTDIPSVDSYQVWYRPAAGGAWTKKIAGTNFKTLKSLTPATMYEYKVRTTCADGTLGEFSSIENFTTSPLREDEIAFEFHVDVYPNPASDVLYIDYMSLQQVSIQLFDITGNLINIITISEEKDLIWADISNLPKGVYFLHVSDSTEKMVVEFIHQ